jgi:hypothetical protein
MWMPNAGDHDEEVLMLSRSIQPAGVGVAALPHLLACPISGWRMIRSPLRPLILLLLLPAVLAPNHPVAVYGFLMATSVRPAIYPDSGADMAGLARFLISPAQTEHYRTELLADMGTSSSGGFFVVVRNSGGTLRHAQVRTWNSFVPESLLAWTGAWLDYKEFPFLGDEVALWLNNETVVAVGHYHAFGGGPSPGDRIAQNLSGVPEIVVSNGLVPLVYLDGRLLPYGDGVEIPPEVFRSIRTLDRGISMANREVPAIVEAPTPAMISLLSFLRDHEGTDITRTVEVAKAILGLCLEFKRSYAHLFPRGFLPGSYSGAEDHATMLENLAILEGWAVFQIFNPPDREIATPPDPPIMNECR